MQKFTFENTKNNPPHVLINHHSQLYFASKSLYSLVQSVYCLIRSLYSLVQSLYSLFMHNKERELYAIVVRYQYSIFL